MSEERIVRFSRDEVPKGRTDLARLRAVTDEEIERAAAEDPENPLLTEDELAQLQPVYPEDRVKMPVYIRLDPDIVEFFKSGGPGYQTRINAALRDYVERATQTGNSVAAD
jgi:uncharacterized protein (DUF4415 family)